MSHDKHSLLRDSLSAVYRSLRRSGNDNGPRWQVRLIPDATIAVGSKSNLAGGYRVDIDKESLSRDYVLNRIPARTAGQRLRFLDVGGRDGELSYLLGNVAPLQFDAAAHTKNKARFDAIYDYFGVDLHPAGDNVLHGNICDRTFLDTYADFKESFDVIYSNNVFEHFDRPWIAAEILLDLLKIGGICITIVPFSQRYHESPGDHFRYTHTGVGKLFDAAGPIKILEAGYDIRARRYDWQGSGGANDIVPVDRFGAWRETWLTVCILEKLEP